MKSLNIVLLIFISNLTMAQMQRNDDYCNFLTENNKVVFISPHLDDAIFSCGGLISRLKSDSVDVEVITIYTKQPDTDKLPMKLKKFANVQERAVEDSAALNSIHCKILHLGFLERAFSKPYIQSPPKIFKSPEEGKSGFYLKNEIKSNLLEIIKNNPDARFFFPLGLGNHYDHVQVLFALFELLEENDISNHIYLYEDPYTWLGNSIKKKHPVGEKYLYPLKNWVFFKSIKGFFMSKVISLVINNKLIKEELCREFTKYDFKEIRINISKEVFSNKIDLCNYYKSQIEGLGGKKTVIAGQKNSWDYWDNAEMYWMISHRDK